MGHSKGSPERELHSDTGLPKKNRNISNKQPNLHLQQLKEEQQRQPRASRRKETAKIRTELNGIDNKNTILRINKPRSWFFENINKIKSLKAGSSRKRERGPK